MKRISLLLALLLTFGLRAGRGEDFYVTAFSQSSGRVDLTGNGTRPLARVDSTSKAFELGALYSISINDIRYDAVGSSNVTSGASLIGAFDEFAASSGTNVQDVLDDLDAAISGLGASLAGNPTGGVNGTAVNGVATTFLRSDVVLALADPFTPADGTQNVTGKLAVSGDMSLNTTSWPYMTFGLTLPTFTQYGGATASVHEFAAATDTTLVNLGSLIWSNANNADAVNQDADSKVVASIYSRMVTATANVGDDSGGRLVFQTKPEAGSIADRMTISSTGHIGINTTPIVGAGVDYRETYTDPGAVRQGIVSTVTSISTADNTFGIEALRGDISVNPASTKTDSSSMYGIRGIARLDGAGHVTERLAGTAGQIINSGSGHVTVASSIFAAEAINTGGATVDNAVGVEVIDQTVGTANYGIWLKQKTVGANNYALYQDDADGKSYIGGVLGIQDATPVAPLTVGDGDDFQVSATGFVTAAGITQAGTVAAGIWNGTAVAVGYGGTGLTSGTSGGIPYFSSTSTIASSAALGSTQVVLGGGAGAAPVTNANLLFNGTALTVTRSDNNAYLTLDSQSTKEAGINFKQGGTQRWEQYTPASSTDMRWYSSADMMVLTTAGALSVNGTGTHAFKGLLTAIDGTAPTWNYVGDPGDLGGEEVIEAVQHLAAGQHYLSYGTAPSIAAGAGAGTTPTVSVDAASTDVAGIVNVTTGTLPTGANATIATITYANAFATRSIVTLTPANALTAALGGVTAVYATGTATTFVMTSGATALTASTAYSWNYQVIGE